MTNTARQSEWQRIQEGTYARMLRELQSDLADAVERGDMTAAEANEWAARKADQWAQEY